MTLMKKIGWKILNTIGDELRRCSPWDEGWRIVLLAGSLTFAGTIVLEAIK